MGLLILLQEVLREIRAQLLSISIVPAVLLVFVVTGIPVTLTVIIRRRRSRNDGKQPFKDYSTTSPDDAWEERRRRGIEAASFAKPPVVDDGKPFRSSYYYAHNNSNAKGGYSDGLSMEDYTMNGPRLLSKTGGGGARIDGDDGNGVDESVPAVPVSTATASSSSTTTAQRSTMIRPPIRQITRYQWDDPGERHGVACIRIDELPGATSSESSLAWNDVTVVNVEARLEGAGLLITVQAHDNVEYRLHIPQLYGDVASLQAVQKSKRLLVKLHKTKGFFGNSSNLQAWPHPQKKKD